MFGGFHLRLQGPIVFDALHNSGFFPMSTLDKSPTSAHDHYLPAADRPEHIPTSDSLQVQPHSLWFAAAHLPSAHLHQPQLTALHGHVISPLPPDLPQCLPWYPATAITTLLCQVYPTPVRPDRKFRFM